MLIIDRCYFISTVSQVRFPGKQTLRCEWRGLLWRALRNNISGGEKTGLSSGRNWAVRQSQQRLQQVPKGALQLTGPFGVVQWGKRSGPLHLYTDYSLDVGCLWEGSVTLAKTRHRASPGRDSAVGGSCGWQPQSWRGIWEVHHVQRNLELSKHSSLRVKEVGNEDILFISILQKKKVLSNMSWKSANDRSMELDAQAKLCIPGLPVCHLPL